MRLSYTHMNAKEKEKENLQSTKSVKPLCEINYRVGFRGELQHDAVQDKLLKRGSQYEERAKQEHPGKAQTERKRKET